MSVMRPLQRESIPLRVLCVIVLMVGCAPPAVIHGSAPVSLATMASIEGGDWFDESNTWRHVDDFLLDRREVSVGNYGACVRAGACSDRRGRSGEDLERWRGRGCRSPKTHRSSLPANCITVRQAAEYCAWQRKRLPTILEWIWETRGGDEGRVMPWGTGAATCARVNVLGCEGGRPRAARLRRVDQRVEGASRHGVLDLIGNVGEIVLVENGTYTTVGGSFFLTYTWRGSLEYGAYMQWNMDEYADRNLGDEVGFRCARDP